MAQGSSPDALDFEYISNVQCSACVDCQHANCDKCFQFGDDATCVCVTQGLHGLPTPEASYEDPIFDMYDYVPPGIDIPNHGLQHPFTNIASPDHDHFFASTSNPSSESSYISTPPSPNPSDSTSSSCTNIETSLFT